jgi:anaerobic magnesium-protoporphyrin IX monomethyl ester cyclase
MGPRRRVLLLAPRMHGLRGGINRMQPGLGLGYLAGVLQARGHEVAIYDAALEGAQRQLDTNDPDEVLIGASDVQILEVLDDFEPDFVGIGIPFSTLAEQALAVARLVRQWDETVPIAVGGAHVNGAVSDYLHGLQDRLLALGDGSVDYAMVGECDFAFAELVEDCPPGEVAGVVELGRKPRFPRRKAVVDITQLPLPARDRMNLEGYFAYGRFHSSQSTSNRVLNVMASRGCPEACSFCATPATWGQRVRWRDPDAILHEITDCVERYGIEEIQFEDDSLTAMLAPLSELCERLAGLGLPWCTPNGVKANYHLSRQPEMFDMMRRSGCYQVTLACESGAQRVLDDIVGKRLRVEQVPVAVGHAKRAGLFVHSFWMLGFPGETRAEMQQTVEAAASCGADSVSFSIVTPLPGTPLYRGVVARGQWWPGRDYRGTNFRRSQVQVDGFDSPEAFERWVAEVNAQVNQQAARRDPERAQRRRQLTHDPAVAGSLVKQT